MPELRPPVGRPPDLRPEATRQSRALEAFGRALRSRDCERALHCASRVRGLSLDRALLLTLLLADRSHPSYQAAARRFLVRFTLECETSLIHIKRLADALAHLHHPYFGPHAREGLDDLVGKLRAHERDLWVARGRGPDNLWVEFNSLPE